MENRLIVSSSPHIRSEKSTRSIMLDVIIALVPALIASFFIFGYRAIVLTAISVISCVLLELISCKVRKRALTIYDLSAVVTGLLLAFNLPAKTPYWIPVIGALIAIVMVKEMFGGIGHNFANPALTARIILLLSFGTEMNTFSILGKFLGKETADLVTTATPLLTLKSGAGKTDYLKLFLGQHSGTIGEVCALALILGFIYLLIRGVIKPHIPVVYVLTVALLALISGNDPIYHVLSGGLLLGAIFMATDYVTSPVTNKGKIIFAIGCGVITSLIRFYGASPEGVSYSILLMNLLSPQIENITRNKPVGGVKHA